MDEIEEVKPKPKRRKRPEQSIQVEPGDNKRFLEQKLEIISWGDVVMSDPVAVAERSMKYLECCAKYDMKPTIEGYALALGFERQTLFRYREGQLGKNDAVRDTLKKTCSLINSLMADYMSNGKINPVSGIFLMKNNMGYTDKQEVVIAPKNPLGDVPDQKALEERYIESIVVDSSDD